jgi:hypothetical protein
MTIRSRLSSLVVACRDNESQQVNARHKRAFNSLLGTI